MIATHLYQRFLTNMLTMGVCLLVCLPATFAQDGWTPLIPQKGLKGWKQLGGQATYVNDGGTIVGTTVVNTPNSFLATEKTYGDFILEGEVKFDDTNTGIQFRSLSNTDYQNGRVHGYQMELDPSGRKWSGGIYDEGRRGWLYPVELAPEGRDALALGQWNTFRIEAIGSVIRTWINDIPTAHLIDEMTAEGFIALQVHSVGAEEGGKTIYWKNLRIKTENLEQRPWDDLFVANLVPNTLSEQEKAQGWELLFDGESTEGWRGVGKESFPSSGWKVEDGALKVEPSDGSESQNGGDIVTMGSYSSFEFQVDFKLTEGANSGIKYFITESYGTTGSAIGLEYQILDDERHPDAKLGTDGNRTLASLYDLIPASAGKPAKKPGEWQHARIVVSGEWAADWPNHLYKEKAPDRLVGTSVEHWLNNQKVLEYVRGNQAFHALVMRSKYAEWEGFGNWQEGHILLQDHGDEVHYRSIKVRKR
ncbi:MAG: DUF1080 domain-containing protein [Bacteroidia bacterium]|nr:DUF1080 domain-containing protein [Bacteroidia bacterium]